MTKYEELLTAVENPGDECIETNIRVNNSGYPSLGARGMAHRIVLSLTLGRELLKGECALHTCDNRRCVNPKHLKIGTQSDNILDMQQKGRHPNSPPKGYSHYKTKVTPEQVEFIRSSTLKGTELALMFGVTKSTISDIKRAKRF